MPKAAAGECGLVRRRWRLRGQVQGVGFRPFVYGLARQYGLAGFVRNDDWGVWIEAQGDEPKVVAFERDLRSKRPALAVIDEWLTETVAPGPQETGFEIRASQTEAGVVGGVTVDTAVCPQCLAEMRDKIDRRAGYALINCTQCGPRYSIIKRVPYDRPNTTMAAFAMCPACAQEYADPGDRRFHAQPTACHDCGPKLALVNSRGEALNGDPIQETVKLLRDGKIVAIKGLGGFHLAVRADRAEAVGRLRKLKKRDQKPLAVMCADEGVVECLVELNAEGLKELRSPARPIVLAPRRVTGEKNITVAPQVAEGTHRLGVMLPYTPIHHLILDEAKGTLPVLVMTSGNESDEPQTIDNTEAVARLGELCDAMLWHDRPIERCVDDSVVLDVKGEDLLPIRRARGYSPGEIPLPKALQGVPAGLCLGGELKNTVAVVRGGAVVMSQHLGDLKHPLALKHFRSAIDDLGDLFGVAPRWIAHDLHPAYLSTLEARQRAAKSGVRLLGVQHHHAHAAAVLAEHGQLGPALAVVCDGTGYGTDGTIWGGELLHVTLEDFQRLARIRPLHLPGGDAAAVDTRRCGLALLQQAWPADFVDHPLAKRMYPDAQERHWLGTMIDRQVQTALSSGMGRLFDGLAALLGVCTRNSFEAQAGMKLEALAFAAGEAKPRDEQPLYGIDDGPGNGDENTARLRELSFVPLVRWVIEAISKGMAVEEICARIHQEMAAAWAAVVKEAAARTGLNQVVLSGGVFCNQRLLLTLSARLRSQGLTVWRHRLVPANDGGLALGQAAVAAARLQNVERWAD